MKTGQNVRITYKLPIILNEVKLHALTTSGTVTLRHLQVIQHQDQTTNLTRQIMEGKGRLGGVTFDVLPE